MLMPSLSRRLNPSSGPAGWHRPVCSNRVDIHPGRQTPAAHWGSAPSLPARACGRRRNNRCGTGIPADGRGAPGSPTRSRRDGRAGCRHRYVPAAPVVPPAALQAAGQGPRCWLRHSQLKVTEIIGVHFAVDPTDQHIGCSLTARSHRDHRHVLRCRSGRPSRSSLPLPAGQPARCRTTARC